MADLNITRHKRLLAYITLCFWFCASMASIHGHFCLDGQEPAVSLHLDVLEQHTSHPDDEVHQDVDVEMIQLILAQFSKVNFALLSVMAVFLLLFIQRASPIYGRRTCIVPSAFFLLHPPLRAPPVLPA